MTRTADVPAREPVSRTLREAAGLGLEPRLETLRSRVAPLCERIYDSLIPRLEVKEPHRIALDTAMTLCTERPAVPHPEPDSLTDARSFPHPCGARVVCPFRAGAFAIALGCTVMYGFGMLPADPGRISPYDLSGQNMGNSEDACGRNSLDTGVSI